jgi:NAD(P)H dehydrogenase (quinone)
MLPPLFDPSPDFAEARSMITTLRAALRISSPRRVVALSTIGADAERPNLLNQLGLLEQGLGTLGIPMTFLRPAWFMENAALDIASARERGVIESYLQPLDRAVPMIATADVGRTVADLVQETWDGVRVVELEAAQRVSPDAVASAFRKALGKPVKAEIVPRSEWDATFRAQGMKNPLPRIQMLDGFNQGWIEFADHGARARKGQVGIEEVITALVR